MAPIFKSIFYIILLCLVVFLIGFLASSCLFSEFIKYGLEKIDPIVKRSIEMQINKLEIYPSAKHYFLLSREDYLRFYVEGISVKIAVSILVNALFNSLFQPIFPCVFTPQVILIYLLFPFFLYGAIKYFKKVPIMILFFVVYFVFIGMKDLLIEPLIRHRMACELIYFMIGLAGFTRWITRKSF